MPTRKTLLLPEHGPEDLTVVEIPDDGAEHACVCGSGGYSVWDGDGMARRRFVTGDEGRACPWCDRCGRELVPAAVSNDNDLREDGAS